MNEPVPSSAPYDAWHRRTMIALGIIFLARLLFLRFSPLDLSGDEMYYWDWGRRLDVGYYSKPPLIAWLMRLAGELTGHTTFGIRLFALFLGTGTLYFLYRLASAVYHTKAGFYTVLASALSPGSCAANLMLTIDAPLLFFWSLALLSFWKVAQHKTAGRAWGYLLILALGLGGLTKQMMLVFYPLAIGYLYANQETRWLLRRPLFWLCALLALMFLVPTLIWNLQHDWITVQHTAGHFASPSFDPDQMIGRLVGFLATQAALLSPITFALLSGVLATMLPRLRHARPSERFLWLFSAPGLLVILTLCFRQKINENWPAVFYLSAIPLLSGWALNQFSTGTLYPWRKAFRTAIAVGAVMAVAVYFLAWFIPRSKWAGGKLDPTVRLRGWKDLGEIVHSWKDAPEWPPEAFLLTVGHRYSTSALAFYHPEHPKVYKWPRPGTIDSQYDLWNEWWSLRGRSAVILVSGENLETTDLAGSFAELRFWRRLDIPLGPKATRSYSVYLGHRFLGIPSAYLSPTLP